MCNVAFRRYILLLEKLHYFELQLNSRHTEVSSAAILS